MSKIDDLIKQYCPNGVKYKELSDVCQIEKGQQLNKNSLKDKDKFPVMNGGISPSGYWSEYNTDCGTIIISQGGASAGYTQFMTVKFWAGAHCYTVKPKGIFNKYLYYFIKNNQNLLMGNQYGAGIPALNKKTLETLRIPVPPLPVQEEIVKMLDAFTALEAELEAELEARKRQYEYYRNKLLSFDENTTGGRIKFMQLNEVCKIYDGTHTTPKYTNTGIKFVSVENINDLFSTKKYISNNDYLKYKVHPKKGDVFMTRIGSIGNCAIVDGEEHLAYYVSLALIRPNKNIILSKYVKYIIESSTGKRELAKRTLINAVPIKINLGEIGKITIPVPPLEEQERIVAILDKFDSLVNDISEGLPAELNARKQQYEYYRNKLLTFTPLASEMN